MLGRDKNTKFVLAGVLAAVVTMPAMARAADPSSAMSNPFESSDEFGNLPVISRSELAEMRGGLTLGGLKMEFGANVRTFIDGVLALETGVRFTDSGAAIQQGTSGGSSSGLAGSSSVIVGGGAGAALRDVLPSNVDLSALAGASGVVINDSQGSTTALHQVTRDQIVSVLVNTAHNRRIRQELDVIVNVPNFKQFQQAVGNALLNSRIADAINR